MIQAVIFSKDRPAQLDLLLRSLKLRAPGLIEPVAVIFKSTDYRTLYGYGICEEEHGQVTFLPESDLQAQTNILLEHGEGRFFTFLCDDDVFHRVLCDPLPDLVFAYSHNILCVSLRLGLHTNYCYSLNREQQTPELSFINNTVLWDWRQADADWGYPGSVDGHVFKRDLLTRLLHGSKWWSPNTLEEQLQHACLHKDGVPGMMACYERSVVVGVPVNLVNDTHPNRHGVKHARDFLELNDSYLQGRRLSLSPFRTEEVDSVHTEFPLVFS